MWIVVFLSFLIVTFLVGHKCKEDFIEVLPVTTGGIILLLYILAMFRCMNIIVEIGVAILLIFAGAKILMGKEGREAIAKEAKVFFFSVSALSVIGGIILVAVLTSGHVATWWDDINYWATDAKALYFLNGFTGKYGNVAPEFGDYPPGIQIMKWCFAKLDRSVYREGLAFAGYYVMNMIFSLPILKKLKGKNPLLQVAGVIIVFLLPGVVNDVWSHGACADITMGIVYGAVLISLFDMDGHTAGFYYGRLLVLLSVLPLTKSVGFEWAAYAATLIVISIFIYKDKLTEIFGKKYRFYTIITIVTAVSVQLSWWVYCLLNRRIAKLTSSGAHMAAGGYSLPDNAAEKVSLFARGFAFCPMHTDRTVMFDLSSLTMVVIVILTIVILGIVKKLSRQETIILTAYSAVTAIIAYGIIFVGHITIFATETQYDTPEVMAISISRYAAPFTVGMLMLLIYILTDRISGKWAFIGCAAFVLLTTDYIAAYNCLWGYRKTAESDLEGRNSVIDSNGRVYAECVEGDKRLWGHRVLYFRDASEIHWVKDTYINHEVAPVPTVYTDIRPEAMNSADIINEIATHHAEYIYVDDVSTNTDSSEGCTSNEIFDPLMQDGEEFKYCVIYKVNANGFLTAGY
ncbi:MAG: hypothetical protein KBS96_07780 [Lachnospiraceae bacterium]|nr:hypothetical protein [Candidatus Colinaster scatohippi]